ncbi:hypothetical protein BJX68DRAFT_278380 [Aspergillus pseudodeflectus]|uniref:Cupin 2 conserved barrel domain-containing protein n=1 Tax=Aspergillus pseudodeflectus TaxID=176178 RepID=A0ABR4JR41_9EURO
MSRPTFPPVRRVVTGHDEKGSAIIKWDDLIVTKPHEGAAFVAALWSSSEAPADVSSRDDQALAETGLVNNGSIFRLVDFPPRTHGIVHRSISLDYVLVLKGSITLTLDAGLKTELKEGNVVVQQATMHGWDNETDEWTRLVVVLLPARPPVIDGKELSSDVPF